MILLVDNYDSFSYNLYQLAGSLCPDIRVVRNDCLTVEQIEEKRPKAIILSPGPGRPENAGRCVEIVQKLGGKIPILGVCLGHQALCLAYGGRISHARRLMHGKQSMVSVDTSCPVFTGLPERIPAARYHSLAAESLPDCLKATGRTQDGEIMAAAHREYPVYGLQFHPESILTPQGEKIMENFLDIAGCRSMERDRS